MEKKTKSFFRDLEVSSKNFVFIQTDKKRETKTNRQRETDRIQKDSEREREIELFYLPIFPVHVWVLTLGDVLVPIELRASI